MDNSDRPAMDWTGPSSGGMGEIGEDEMAHYHDSQDLAQAGRLRRLAPDGFAAWEQLHHNSFGTDEGAIPLVYRELMAVAVALAIQCPYCIGTHTAAVQRLGGTEEQLAEAIFVATAVGAGAPLAHGGLALRLYDAAKPAADVGDKIGR